MDAIDSRLLEALYQLTRIKKLCSQEVNQECELKELTFTQIEYLKVIDRFERMTMSDLAVALNNSKPTVTEMIKRFITLQCVYKEKCNQDARKYYIRLTNKGRQIARMEDYTLQKIVAYVQAKLTQQEIDQLVSLIDKIYRERSYSDE